MIVMFIVIVAVVICSHNCSLIHVMHCFKHTVHADLTNTLCIVGCRLHVNELTV